MPSVASASIGSSSSSCSQVNSVTRTSHLLFTLSYSLLGFVLVHSQTRKPSIKPTHFVLQRILPLYPLYLASVALAVMGLYVNGDGVSGWVGWRDVVTTTLMVQSWYEPFHSTVVNGPAWFMCCCAWYWFRFNSWHRSVACMPQLRRCYLLVFVWGASFTPHLICYAIFDIPLYKQYYGKYFHNYLEFHPLNNWSPFVAGLVLGHLLPGVTLHPNL